MLISYFYPNEHHRLFVPYVKKHKFLFNQCTKDADLIYCGSTSQLSKAIVAKQQYGKPLICWVWDLPHNWREWVRNDSEYKAHVGRDKKIKKIVANLRKCERIISASKSTQRILKEKHGLASEQLYFYIDIKSIDAVSSPRKKGHIIQISRFALNKRFDDSIRVTNDIRRKFICIGPKKKNLKGLKEIALKLNANVEFHVGIKRAVAIKLLKEAEILVSPSLHEGWGMTPIEALYCKIPVLLSDLEVFKEIYGENVLYHKKNDSDDMKEKLNRLLRDKKLQRKIVDNCHPLISDFTIPKFIGRWERMISE